MTVVHSDMHTVTCEQFLQLTVGLVLGFLKFVFCMSSFVSLDILLFSVSCFQHLVLFPQYWPRDWLRRISLMCTFTNYIYLLTLLAFFYVYLDQLVLVFFQQRTFGHLPSYFPFCFQYMSGYILCLVTREWNLLVNSFMQWYLKGVMHSRVLKIKYDFASLGR